MSKRKAKGEVVELRFWEGVTKEYELRRSEIRYFGLLKRIPVRAFPKGARRMAAILSEWDESAETMLQSLPDTLPTSMQSWEPIPNGAVERYEAIDRESGDMLIFWRVPCRRKG